MTGDGPRSGVGFVSATWAEQKLRECLVVYSAPKLTVDADALRALFTELDTHRGLGGRAVIALVEQ